MTLRPGQRALAALAIATACLSSAAPAAAQFGLGQPGLGGSPGGKKKPTNPQKGPDGEEQHAATSVDDPSKTQGSEPTLPPDPLEVPSAIKDKIGADVDPDADEKGRSAKTERDWYGLYFRERSNRWQFQTLLPLWFERKQPQDRASLFGFYYNRRSPQHDADILPPFMV